MKSWERCAIVLVGVLTTAGVIAADSLKTGQRTEDWRTTVSSLTLGTVNGDGGTESVEAATTAIPTAGQINITGTVVNKTDEKWTDMTIQIVSTSPTGSIPPKIITAQVQLPGNPPPNPITVAVGPDNTVNIPFGGGGVSGNQSCSISIDVDAPSTPPGVPSVMNKVYISPSVGPLNQMAESDTYGAYIFEAGGATVSNTNLLHAHDAGYCRVHNLLVDGDDEVPIVRFDGAMTFAGGSNSLSSVTLVNPDNDYKSVVGATATITSATSFDITSFSLAAGTNLGLVVEFTNVPSGSTSLQLEATFDQ
jgi:hypothetical protein